MLGEPSSNQRPATVTSDKLMTRERWQEVKAVLAAALERAPAERPDFLRQICGENISLLHEVESLIAYEQAGDKTGESLELGFEFGPRALADLSGSGLDVPLNDDESMKPDRRIGPYEIVRELGRGGMGAVYLARRADEYRQHVAIKLIRRGMDTDLVLRRFRNERQILAALDHPNIARLLDGGTTEDGLPYLVMEYVEGEPLDAYCDRCALNTEERLRVFRQVCDAVHYAHQRLVIHRDIKPSNILVTREGIPKLLDFGIAKLLTPELAAQTLDATSPALRLMTPLYASPEQIKGEPITTTTDVYSLGVLLYELLTGHRPYRVRNAATHEVIKAVLEEEPAKPSTVVLWAEEVRKGEDSSCVTLTPESASKLRGVTPDRLRRRLRGDLDNIVLTALRKDPARRYASVEQFSEDVRRHLEGLPVFARKDTLGYRTVKFIRRNRIGVAGAIIVVIMLLSGIIVINQQRARAERRFNDVRKLAHSVVFDYHDRIADLPGSTPVRERLVKDALEYLDSLAGEAGSDRSLQRELAMAYRKIGDVQGNSNMANLGDTNGALASYQKSLIILQALVEAEPANAELKAELPESFERIGDILQTKGDVGEADQDYRQAISLLESLSASAPQDRALRRKLADLLSRLANLKGRPRTANLGDTKGAVEYHRRALAIREGLCADDPTDAGLRIDLQNSHKSIATLLSTSGDDPIAGEPHARQALNMARELVAAAPASVRMLRALLLSQDTLARLLLKKGEMDDALELCNQSLNTARTILAADPVNMQARQELASGHVLAGNILGSKGDTTGALRYHRQALTLNRAIAADDPNNESADRWVAQDHMNIGFALSLAGDLRGALRSHQQGLAMFEELCRKNPNDFQTRLGVARGYKWLGETLTKLGDATGALEGFRQSVDFGERMLVQDPSHETARRIVAVVYFNIGELCARLAVQAKPASVGRAENFGEARKAYQRSLDLMLELRNRGVLGKENADKPDLITRKIALCDGALAKRAE
jgi:serine/threonine protein kinase/tetratricopeptide (TPR) repeat protein